MPKFTIDLSQKAVDKLQTQHVDRSNGANGTALTLKDWIVLHLNELAITADLPAAIGQLQRESQDTLTAAIRTTRDRLIREL